MKCPICDGMGTSNTCVNGTFKPCIFCDGTGEYEPFDADVELDKLYPTKQTNEEWFDTLSTEEKAKVLFSFFGDGVTFCERNYSNTHLFFTDDEFVSEDSVFKWLKEKHNG